MKNDDSNLEGALIFEAGKDPHMGEMRIVGNLEKVELNSEKRSISFKEIHEVVFGKGRSTLVDQYVRIVNFKGVNVEERQFRVVGLTTAGRVLLVVFTPRDEFGVAKRIITCWQVGKDSDEYKKLLIDCPHLNFIDVN